MFKMKESHNFLWKDRRETMFDFSLPFFIQNP